MDLHLAATVPTDAERQAVDAVLAGAAAPAARGELQQAAAGGRVGVGGVRIRHGVRHLLLPALHGVQDAIGWISPAALNYVSERLGVPPAEAYGVATFYSLLSTTEQPPRVAHVCDDIACRGAGALHLCRQLEQRLGPAHHAGGPVKAAHHGASGHGTGAAGTGTGSPATGATAKEHAAPRRADAGGTDRTAPGGAATGGIATNAVATAAGGVTALVAADEVAADAVILSGRATWLASPCLGLCEAAPAVLLQLAGEPAATLAPATADAVCAALAAAPADRGGGAASGRRRRARDAGGGRSCALHRRRQARSRRRRRPGSRCRARGARVRRPRGPSRCRHQTARRPRRAANSGCRGARLCSVYRRWQAGSRRRRRPGSRAGARGPGGRCPGGWPRRPRHTACRPRRGHGRCGGGRRCRPRRRRCRARRRAGRRARRASGG